MYVYITRAEPDTSLSVSGPYITREDAVRQAISDIQQHVHFTLDQHDRDKVETGMMSDYGYAYAPQGVPTHVTGTVLRVYIRRLNPLLEEKAYLEKLIKNITEAFS